MSNVIVREELSKHIVSLRLNRHEVHNACNYELLETLTKLLAGLEEERDLRALIITGTGKSFSSGGDLKQIKEFGPGEAAHWCDIGHRLMEAIERLPVPVLAAVNGHCLGGGLELALACDLRYSVETAKFGCPEARVGMITGWGGTYRLPRIVGLAKAKELVFTAELISANEALGIGLVNAVFPEEGFMDRVVEVARKIAVAAPHSNRLSKRMLNRYPFDLTSVELEESLALSQAVTTEDKTEAIQAFLEKREPHFMNR